MGHREDTNNVFMRANNMDPNLAVVKQQIGNFLTEKEDYGLAMHYYLNAIELEPGVASCHYGMGELYYQIRNEFVKDGILNEVEFNMQMVTAFKEATRLEPIGIGC